MTQKSYGVIDDPLELQRLVDRMLGEGKPFGFDIETGYDGPPRDAVALHPEEGFVVGFSLTNSTEWARYVPLRHDIATNMDVEEFCRIVWPLMATGLGVAHNAKFEGRFLSRLFRMFAPEAKATRGYYPYRSDTMVEAYMLAHWQSFALKALTKAVFGHEQAELSSLFPELAKNKMKTLRFNALELTPAVVAYACEDALWCLALHEKHYHQVKDMFLYKVEMELQRMEDGLPGALPCMEDYGVLYDWTMMERSAAELEQFLDAYYSEIMAELTAMLGRPMTVNLGSSKQVSDLLYGELGLKTTRLTKGSRESGIKKMSTDKVALAGLSKKYPIVDRIVKWKEMKKLLSTYLQTYPKRYSYAPDGRTHPNIMQTAVITGRFAVDGPPYQQTPKKYHYDLKEGGAYDFPFRDVITAGPDHYLMGYDYSQVELRWLAGVAQEPGLLEAFRNGVDVHVQTASLMLGVALDQVTKDHRAVGKTMNFGLMYGMQAKSLGERLGISRDEAEALFQQYFSSFSSVAVWVDRVTREGIRNGYTTSHMGRRHTIWELQSPDRWIYEKGKRLCVNAPIQGGAADYMKVAMVKAHRALVKAGLVDKVHLVMNIHDALIFEVHVSVHPQTVYDVLQPAVVYQIKGFPDFVADWSVGRRWGSMRELVIQPDGTLKVKKPEEVQPEDVADPFGEDEEGEPLPTDDIVQAVRSAAALPVAAMQAEPVAQQPLTPVTTELTGKELIVEIADMPDERQYEKWLDLLRQSRGGNAIVLVTPDGRVPYPGLFTSLTPDDAARISLVFAGASAYYSAESVDLASITAGMQL